MGEFASFKDAKWQAGSLMANAAGAMGKTAVYSSNKSSITGEEESHQKNDEDVSYRANLTARCIYG